MATLKWEVHGPRPDPFEALAGDTTTYTSYYATSSAVEIDELRAAFAEVIDKALSLASLNESGGKKLLFIWDAVYSTLSVAYTDDTLLRFAHHTVKCSFDALDEQMQAHMQTDGALDEDNEAWETATAELSERVQKLLAELMAAQDLSALPPSMGIYFSDEDPETSASEFTARELIARTK